MIMNLQFVSNADDPEIGTSVQSGILLSAGAPPSGVEVQGKGAGV
jgi:hypothetical protein